MRGSSFDDVVLVNPTQVLPVAAEEVARAESELAVPMPPGYAEYVRRLGEGALGHFVRVYTPGRLPDLTLDWRKRIQEYWFWDTTDAGVAPEGLQERGVLVADTFDGDELCFDPADPRTLFVLPANEDVAQRVGPGFLAAVSWMLSGVLNPWTEGWTFEAWTNRVEVRRAFPSRRLTDAARAITELGEHSHLLDLGDRKTFFLPQIGGRLSVYQFEGQDLAMDLTYDEAADPDAVDQIVSAI